MRPSTGHRQPIEHTVKTWGNEAILIPYATAIWSASGFPFERLMNCYGGHLGIYGDYSCMQLQAACDLLYGDDGYYSGSTLDEVAHADLIVFFGANPALTRMEGQAEHIALPQAREKARAEGKLLKTIAVDPYQSDVVIRDGDEWIPIRPGTDAAFVGRGVRPYHRRTRPRVIRPQVLHRLRCPDDA